MASTEYSMFFEDIYSTLRYVDDKLIKLAKSTRQLDDEVSNLDQHRHEDFKNNKDNFEDVFKTLKNINDRLDKLERKESSVEENNDKEEPRMKLIQLCIQPDDLHNKNDLRIVINYKLESSEGESNMHSLNRVVKDVFSTQAGKRNPLALSSVRDAIDEMFDTY